MPNLAEAPRTRTRVEDPFLDLLVETLENLDRPVRGQFLQRFLKALAQVELTDTQSLEYWEQILARRKELSESLGNPISLKTAMVDVLAATNFLRLPILMEYEELKKLQINAATDALTGLYNRRLFQEYFDKELNRAKRYGQHLALMILDLHRFKDVNDRYGHLQGDQLLQMAATTLQKTLRASDYAFRIGGDEFALLLPQSDPEQAATLGRRIRAHFESAVLPMKLEVPLGLDYGISVFPFDGEQKEALLRVADERLYQLKNSARAQPRVIPMETPPVREVTPPVGGPAPTPPPRPGVERRKWERVSLEGTRASAVLSGNSERTARVIDLSYGGVALQIDRPEELPNSFYAVLHVPILPPVRVSLRKIYAKPLEGSRSRVGCSFVS